MTPTPSEIRKLASSKPVSTNGNCMALIDWINNAAWALKDAADAMETRDLNEDPVCYLVTHTGHLDFTTICKSYDRAKACADSWNDRGGDFAVVPLFLRPGVAK